MKLFCTHTQKILCSISGGNNSATSSKDVEWNFHYNQVEREGERYERPHENYKSSLLCADDLKGE